MASRGWRDVSLERFLVDDDYVCWRSRACARWRAPGGYAGVFCTEAQELSDLEDTWLALGGFRFPWRFLADARRFRANDPSAIYGHMMLHGPAMALKHRELTDRGALLLPDDWTQAWWLGALETWQVGRTRVAASLDDAWSFLEAPELGVEVEELTRRCTEEHDVIARAQSALRAEPALDLAALAQRLGLSSRSLQRELARTSESFAALRDRVRYERAQELLRRTNEKIETIALDVGFRSRAHFASWFRARSGKLPVDLRRER